MDLKEMLHVGVIIRQESAADADWLSRRVAVATVPEGQNTTSLWRSLRSSVQEATTGFRVTTPFKYGDVAMWQPENALAVVTAVERRNGEIVSVTIQPVPKALPDPLADLPPEVTLRRDRIGELRLPLLSNFAALMRGQLNAHQNAALAALRERYRLLLHIVQPVVPPVTLVPADGILPDDPLADAILGALYRTGQEVDAAVALTVYQHLCAHGADPGDPNAPDILDAIGSDRMTWRQETTLANTPRARRILYTESKSEQHWYLQLGTTDGARGKGAAIGYRFSRINGRTSVECCQFPNLKSMTPVKNRQPLRTFLDEWYAEQARMIRDRYGNLLRMLAQQAA